MKALCWDTPTMKRFDVSAVGKTKVYCSKCNEPLAAFRFSNFLIIKSAVRVLPCHIVRRHTVPKAAPKVLLIVACPQQTSTDRNMYCWPRCGMHGPHQSHSSETCRLTFIFGWLVSCGKKPHLVIWSVQNQSPTGSRSRERSFARQRHLSSLAAIGSAQPLDGSMLKHTQRL
eukprot:4106039-Amphidinium_carterae.1